MLLNDNGRNALLSGGLGNVITHVSLLTLSSLSSTTLPDDTGTLEASGGSYARQAVTWAAASTGTRNSSGALTWSVPASTTVVAYGFHSALTAGTFYGSAPHNGTAAKNGVGTVAAADVTANTITSVGHTLANTDRVFVCNIMGTTIPVGLAEGTLYFVVGSATDTFQVSLTSGGAAVDITGSGGGEVAFFHCIPELFSSAGSLTVASGSLSLDATYL